MGSYCYFDYTKEPSFCIKNERLNEFKNALIKESGVKCKPSDSFRDVFEREFTDYFHAEYDEYGNIVGFYGAIRYPVEWFLDMIAKFTEAGSAMHVSIGCNAIESSSYLISFNADGSWDAKYRGEKGYDTFYKKGDVIYDYAGYQVNLADLTWVVDKSTLEMAGDGEITVGTFVPCSEDDQN